MTKTPDEIKKLLTNYKRYTFFSAEALFADALACIQQLERERDAAVAILEQFHCASCIHEEVLSGDEPCASCCRNCDIECDGIGARADNWQWRGVQNCG